MPTDEHANGGPRFRGDDFVGESEALW